MEPEDNQRFSQRPKMTMQLSSNSSDYFRSVQQVQTSKCRRRKRISEMAEFPEEHHCSSSACSRSTIFSSSPLVLFLLTSALVLFMCVSPSHSLPFDGRSLSSSGGGSHRSQVDLLIDPIHQAEYGDDDPFENTRVVKSVFDMVLRTPPPPTSSSNRCPPGTQSPYDGAPCIKKSTDPVAFVDQSFLLDTLRGLTQKGELLGGRQKNRRPGGGPGSNRRRTSGRPGLRTSTTTPAPSTTLSSEDEEGEMSPTASTFGSSDISATGDISNLNVVEEDMGAITQEPSTSTPLETTLAPASEGDEAETVMPVNEASASSSEQLSVVETTMAPQQSTEPPVTTTVEAVTTTSTTVPTTTTTTTTTEVPVIKNGADLRRTAAPAESLLSSASPPVPSSSSAESSIENDEQVITVSSSSAAIQTTTTTTTSATTLTPTTPSIATEEVKSDQVHKEENAKPVQVPTAPTTIVLTNTESTPAVASQSVATSQNDADTVQISNSQVIPESHSVKQVQDDHHTHPETIPSLETFVTITTQPAFSKEDIIPLTSSVDVEDKEHAQDSISVSSTTGPTSPPPAATTVHSSPQPHEPVRIPVTTVNLHPNPSGAVTGAENQVVTGVIPSDDHPLHQHSRDEQLAMIAPTHESMEDAASVEKLSAEVDQEVEKVENLAKMMGVRMLRLTTTDETPQAPQEDQPVDKDDNSSDVIVEVSSSEMSPTELEERAAEAHSKEPQVNHVAITSTIIPSMPATVVEVKEEEIKKAMDSAIVAREEVEASASSVPTDKVPRPLGPLENNTNLAEPDTIVQSDQDAVEEAGDMTMTRQATTENDPQKKGVNEAGVEQGDGQPSSNAATTDAVVNHLKDEEQEKETVTLQVEDVDLPISTTNLPASVSPIQLVSEEEKEMPSPVPIMENSGAEEVAAHKYEEIYLSSREKAGDVISAEIEAHEKPIFVKDAADSILETTLVPPPAPSTDTPGTRLLQSFRPENTLLQFQLPIVTRMPHSETAQKQNENDAINSFQTFPSFAPEANLGKVRFPGSAEQEQVDKSPVRSRGTLKPIFVQDFHLDYPPRQEEAPALTLSPQPPQQQWQVPQPFNVPDSTSQQPQQQSATLPDYYDTGSTEYLESELDRRHQKTRSRNRLSNTQQPTVPNTTGQPILPLELSFYSPQPQRNHQQQPSPQEQLPAQHHHPQQPLFFARRNPSADTIPFGYLNFRTGHDRFHHNNRRLIW